jgi:hypothetical protein
VCNLLVFPRFQSDPNQGGVEKLSVSAMRPDMGMKPPHKIAATEISDQYEGYVDGVGSFMVKGWTRSYCAVSIMLCAWQCDEFRQARPEFNSPVPLPVYVAYIFFWAFFLGRSGPLS